MATDSTVTEEEILEDEDVEVAEATDETPVVEEAEEAAEEETAQQFEKRFTQFKGETPDEYAKNLEDAYGHSTTEATRLAQQVKDLQLEKDRIMAQVANNPELAAQIMGQTAPANGQTQPVYSDPALLFARQTMEEQMTKEFNQFAEEHPEIQTNQELSKQVVENLSAISEAYRLRTGKIPTMKEGLAAAWIMAGKSLTDDEETTRMAIKNSASQSKSPTGRPTASPEKPLFTKAQMDFARRAFPEKSNDELVTMLSEHVQP